MSRRTEELREERRWLQEEVLAPTGEGRIRRGGGSGRKKHRL